MIFRKIGILQNLVTLHFGKMMISIKRAILGDPALHHFDGNNSFDKFRKIPIFRK